jgi:hypothetical protein
MKAKESPIRKTDTLNDTLGSPELPISMGVHGMSETELQSAATVSGKAATVSEEKKGKQKNSWKHDFLEMLNQFQYFFIGPIITFITRRLGIEGAVVVLIMFLCGIALGLIPTYFGLTPRSLVSDKYKVGLRKAADSERFAPNMNLVQLGRNKPEWLQPYVSWTQNEGEALKASGAFLHFGADVVSYELQNPTNEFVWSLKANPGFDLDGRAFRVTREESAETTSKGRGDKTTVQEFIQPLKYVKDGASVNFEVPACEKNDRLYVVVFARWQQEFEGSVEVNSTFESVVK